MAPINNSTNIANQRFPSTHSRSRPQLRQALFPLTLVFLIVFLFLFSHLPLTSSTLFANEAGLSSDQRLHVTGVDVKEILRTTRDTSVEQGVSIDDQALDLIELHSRLAVMRADVTRLNVVLTEQARLLERQALVLEQQRVMLVSLEAYTHNNTLRLASIDADAGVQADRTALGEFVTERLTRNVTDNQDAARTLNHTVAVEHATNLTSLDGTVVMHQNEIDTLQSVDSTLIATATELSHNATRLSDRVAELISASSTLTDRITTSESTLAGLTDRMVTLEADAAVIGLVQSRHYLSINELESTSTNHTTRLQQLEDAAAIAQSNIDTLKQHDIDTTVILAAIANAAMSLRARVTQAESLAPGSSQLADQVLNAQQRALLQASHIADLEAALKTANASIVQRQTNEELAVEGLKQRIDGLESDTATLQSNTESNSTRLRTSTTYVTDLVINFKIPKMYRFVFLQSSTWTVPAGVTSAFITLAGGGGSGYGWRIVNALNTGSSGGYLFSTPVTLVPGETITVTVGRGGAGVRPSPRAGQPPYVYFAPDGDDGFKGNAGFATVLTSAINGDLIQCSGAAGASVGRYDGLTGTTIPSLDGVGQSGFWTGSGKGQYFVPSVPSGGPYGVTWGPGVCGPDSLGIGNAGLESYLAGSGTWKGGKTPFGYGSGGDVGRWGCYVNPSTVGTCIFPDDGRDGIAFIDVMY